MHFEEIIALDNRDLCKKVAELLNWKNIEEHRWETCAIEDIGCWYQGTREYTEDICSIPNFPVDLNACQDMERVMDNRQCARYCEIFLPKFCVDHPVAICTERAEVMATARQRCQAFVMSMTNP